MNYREEQPGEARFLFCSAVLFGAFAFLYLVLPVAGRFGSVLLGSQRIPGDSLLGAAILEWGFRSLWSAHLHLFEWNAGFPVHNSLAVTENLIGWQVMYSPLRFAGLGVAAAYNVLLIASLIISGVGAVLLSRRLGADRWGAAVAGFIFALGPYHLANLMNIATMSVCWTPFAIYFLDRFLERADARNGIGLAAAFLMTALSGIYFGVFLVVMLLAYTVLAWVFRRQRFGVTTLVRLAVVATATAVLFTPVAVKYLEFARANPITTPNSVTDLVGLSLAWSSPLRTPEFQLAWSHTALKTDLWNASPAFVGIIALALIIAAMILSRKDSDARRAIWILACFVLVAYLLALGPYFRIPSLGAERVVEWVPMPARLWLRLHGIRWSSRIYLFGWLGAALVAGFGLTIIRSSVSAPRRRIVAIAAVALIAIEYFPSRALAIDSVKVVQPISVSDSYSFLANESDSGGILELPESGHRGSPFVDLYIYGASGHLRRIVGLHGSRNLSLTDSLEAAGRQLPEQSARKFLSNHGVTRLVLHRTLGDTARSALLIRALTDASYRVLFNGGEGVVFDVSATNDPMPMRRAPAANAPPAS